MSFEELSYLEVDYDADTFTILKQGTIYTYDIHSEIDLLNQILDSGNVEYEIYGQEREL
jgi:hypothetical protein